jgi:metal-sulfur cluster biosynthetic enzyme
MFEIDENNLDTKLGNEILDRLKEVFDPDIPIDIVNLGLVYEIIADKNKRAIVRMTLTTPACPLTDTIESEIAAKLSDLVDGFQIDWVWFPPWSLDSVTPEGKDLLRSFGMNF